MEKESEEKKWEFTFSDKLGLIFVISVILFFLIHTNVISINVDFSQDRSLSPEATAFKKALNYAEEHPIKLTTVTCSASDNPTYDNKSVINNEIYTVAIGEITHNADESISFEDSMDGNIKTLKNCTVLQ